jgi:hypothetical protein
LTLPCRVYPYLISGSGHVQRRSWEAQEHPPKILEQKVLEMFWPL